jgi:hypothetical protein
MEDYLPMSSPQKEHNIFIATPAYGFQTYVNYVNGLISFIGSAPPEDLKYKMTFHVHAGGALISHARNDCVHKFLKSDCTKLLFIDADIGFDAENVWRLLRKDVEFAIAPYVTKSIANVNDSKFILGFGDEDLKVDEDGFVKVETGPAGFMMLDREVLNKMINAYPERKSRIVHLQNGEAVTDTDFHTFFDCMVDEEKGALGEDISFCKRWTDIGGEIYCDAYAALTHYGVHSFQGQLAKSIEHGRAGLDEEGNKKIEISL